MPELNVDDRIKLALLEQEAHYLKKREAEAEQKLALLDKRVDDLEARVKSWQTVISFAIGVGFIIGWVISVWDRLRSWFHFAG